jgi:hypothetical protein
MQHVLIIDTQIKPTFFKDSGKELTIRLLKVLRQSGSNDNPIVKVALVDGSKYLLCKNITVEQIQACLLKEGEKITLMVVQDENLSNEGIKSVCVEADISKAITLFTIHVLTAANVHLHAVLPVAKVEAAAQLDLTHN